MKRSLLCAVLVVAFGAACGPRATRLSPEDRNVLQDLSSFRPVGSLTNLPPSVVVLCADDKGRLAERGGRWEPTDVISDQTLPRNRLIWAAGGGEHWVVHYERGGRGHSYHVLVAAQMPDDAKPRVVWRAVGTRLVDYPAFVAAVAKNELDDDPTYAH
jgi:hypothetical protein